MVASKSRLCFTCLRVGHMRNQYEEKSCTQCRGRYHNLLHDAYLKNNGRFPRLNSQASRFVGKFDDGRKDFSKEPEKKD